MSDPKSARGATFDISGNNDVKVKVAGHEGDEARYFYPADQDQSDKAVLLLIYVTLPINTVVFHNIPNLHTALQSH